MISPAAETKIKGSLVCLLMEGVDIICPFVSGEDLDQFPVGFQGELQACQVDEVLSLLVSQQVLHAL